MKELLYGIVELLAKIHSYLLRFNDAYEYNFSDKELQEPLIEGWIDSTKNRLSGCYFNFLTEAGLLTTDGKRHIITPPLLDISLERYLEVKGETAMIKALTGVN